MMMKVVVFGKGIDIREVQYAFFGFDCMFYRSG